METIEVTRNSRTDQFSIVMTQGSDTIRCMVSVALGDAQDNRSDSEMRRAALSKAKALAKAMYAAIEDPSLREVAEGLGPAAANIEAAHIRAKRKPRRSVAESSND